MISGAKRASAVLRRDDGDAISDLMTRVLLRSVAGYAVRVKERFICADWHLAVNSRFIHGFSWWRRTGGQRFDNKTTNPIEETRKRLVHPGTLRSLGSAALELREIQIQYKKNSVKKEKNTFLKENHSYKNELFLEFS